MREGELRAMPEVDISLLEGGDGGIGDEELKDRVARSAELLDRWAAPGGGRGGRAGTGLSGEGVQPRVCHWSSRSGGGVRAGGSPLVGETDGGCERQGPERGHGGGWGGGRRVVVARCDGAAWAGTRRCGISTPSQGR